MKVEEYLNSIGTRYVGYPAHISVSQIERWQKCPHSWLLNYASDALPSFPERMLLGTAVHKGLETAGYIKMTGNVYVSQLDDICEVVTQHINSTDLTSYDGVDVESMLLQTRKVLSGSIQAIEELPPPLFLEKSIEGLSLAGIPLVGYIDIVNADEILDIKVGKRHKTELQAAKTLQLAIYAHAMGIKDVGFLSVSSTTGAYKIIRHQHTSSDIETFVKYAEYITNSIDAAKNSDSIFSFPPNPNGYWCGEGCSHCIYCPYSGLQT